MDAGSAHDGEGWQRVAGLQQLREAGRLTLKIGRKQIALFQVGAAVHACNNRCPHEGYPLAEGTLGADCVLTCHWHNWKFDIRCGDNLYGGDALRIYPARVVDGEVWLDLHDPPREQRIAALLVDLDAAMDEHDYPRIARETARLEAAGAPVPEIVLHAIERSHVRLRYGMTHAYAAAEVWLRLRDELADDAERLSCVTEVLAHIAFDTLREPAHGFTAQARPWDEAGFLAAVENQDEALAAGHLHGALAQGLGMRELELALSRAALSHYSDFGHSLIYLVHLGDLVQRLGSAALRPLLLAWLRSLVFATREDLLPDFHAYAPALAAWPAAGQAAVQALDAQHFVGQSIKQTLQLTLQAARSYPPPTLQQALFGAATEHLLRFDVQHEQRSDNGVADNVGWLDLTHAITFARAVRRQCSRWPELWPQGLLQLALFVGRNSAYLGPAAEAPAVGSAEAFDHACIAQLLDHGLQPVILAVHLLKTWDAARTEGVEAPALRPHLNAAVRRLFDANLKQKHVLRVARQALSFVGKEG